ncbi:hypothetical protein HU200_002495 [Digitaria exilis]|uniref:Uncharacterized protein n=1 Tax=Digitaria exilis TaxID=1010633 RepID=A0A835FWR4_9POAL|nr:hypothetical protein HU200_002495 [Digitaria exilis]
MKEQRPMSADLNKRGLMPVDCVHAFLSLVVFLTIAGNGTHHIDNSDSSSPPSGDPTDSNASSKVEKLPIRRLIPRQTLLQLLPTGPVLAFQTLASELHQPRAAATLPMVAHSGLVTFLGATCIFFAFTVASRTAMARSTKAWRCRHVGLYILSLSNEERKKIPSARAQEASPSSS